MHSEYPVTLRMILEDADLSRDVVSDMFGPDPFI
jgi:hypothetical protein